MALSTKDDFLKDATSSHRQILERLIERLESDGFPSVFESRDGGSTRLPSQRYRPVIEGQFFRDTTICASAERSGFIWIMGRDLIKTNKAPHFVTPFAGEEGKAKRMELAERLKAVHPRLTSMDGLVNGGSPKFGIGLLGNEEAFEKFCRVMHWKREVYRSVAPDFR